jgi:hypothetical protein
VDPSADERFLLVRLRKIPGVPGFPGIALAFAGLRLGIQGGHCRFVAIARELVFENRQVPGSPGRIGVFALGERRFNPIVSERAIFTGFP